jgi:hypothetical protein
MPESANKGEGKAVRGLVAKLLNDEELVINRGSRDGVVSGMEFFILDVATEHIKDPETGEDLGGVPRWKAVVTITAIGERVSLAERKKPASGLTNPFAFALTGGSDRRKARVTEPSSWPDGVVVGDAVVGQARRQ